MNPFTFTALRKRLFIILLTVFFGVPLVMFGVLFGLSLVGSFLSFYPAPLLVLNFAFIFGYQLYFLPPAVVSFPLLGYGKLFVWEMLGATPVNIWGYLFTIVCYLTLAFIISWGGSLKRDSAPVAWKKICTRSFLKKTMLICLLLVIIATGALYYYTQQLSDTGEGEPLADRCKKEERDIKQMLNGTNFCTTDSDCAVIDGFGCPFGCYLLANKTIEVSKIKLVTDMYFQSCVSCVYDCSAPPTQSEISCINGRCKVH